MSLLFTSVNLNLKFNQKKFTDSHLPPIPTFSHSITCNGVARSYGSHGQHGGDAPCS